MNTKIRTGSIVLVLVASAIGMLGGTAAGDSVGNDTFTAADLVTPGTYNGQMTHTVDSVDYYKWMVELGQYFTVNCTVGTGDQTAFTVYGINQGSSMIGSSGYKVSGLSWSFKYTIGQGDSGYYYVKADGDDSNYTFTLEVFDQWDAGQKGDAGDTILTPREIGIGNFTGWLANKDDKDYYKWTVPPGATFYLTLTSGDSPGAVSLTVYKPDKNMLMSTGYLNPTVSKSLHYTTSDSTGGSYTLLAQSSENNYTIGISMTYPDDVGSGTDVAGDIHTAYWLPGNGTYTGSLIDADKKDAYRFNVSAGQMFYILFTNGDTELNDTSLEIYKPDKNMLTSTGYLNPGVSKAKSWITSSAGGGTYYLLVEGENTYTIEITIEDQNDAGILGDSGDDIDHARPVEAAVEHPGLLGDDDNHDYYSFTGTKGAALTVDFILISGTTTGRISLYGPDRLSKKSTSYVNQMVPTKLEYTLTADGTHYLDVQAGNNNYTFNITLGVTDDVKPSVNITSPASGAAYATADINLAGNAADNIGVVLVQWSRDNATWANCSGTGAWTAAVTLNEGGNTFHVRALDAAGNIGFASRQLTVYLDRANPVVAVTTPANGSVLTTVSIAVGGTATDNIALSKVELSVGSGAWIVASGTATWSLVNFTLAQGANTINVKVTDSAGNTNTTQLIVTVDSLAPSAGFTTPANGTKVTKAKLKVTGTASDNLQLAKVELTLNGAPVQLTGTTSWEATVNLTVGSNVFVITATDGAGQKASQTLYVTYKKPTNTKAQPGFEALFLVAALAVGLILLYRRRD